MSTTSGAYVLISWLFLRALGLIYCAAFASFGLQVTGLIGEHGLLPARDWLARVRSRAGRRSYLLYPTLAWLNAGATALKVVCVVGAVLGALLLAGASSTLVLVLLWACYLSLVAVGQVFLSYQWDALLLEVGFLAVFLVPPCLLPGPPAAPPLAVIFLFRWLLFRLMFMSGMMKLVSRDPTWRDLTAMTYHYETQPLPMPLAWYAHRSPLWFQKLSTLMTLIIELVIPFTFLAPAPIRFAGGSLTVFLQVLILLTGNFAFFNWLTIVLALFLYDDALVLPLLPVSLGTASTPAAWPTAVLALVAAFLVVVGLWHVVTPLLPGVPRPVLRLFRPLLLIAEITRSVNAYGLFASMTTSRPEIVLEGSDDGALWLPYEFKYKAGALQRPPPIVAPHQPRLDWQMWFAALRYPALEPWLIQLVTRLLDGSPQAIALLGRNPFPDHPPHYVRAVLYDYHFTGPAERARTGAWWRREMLGLFIPPVTLGGKTP